MNFLIVECDDTLKRVLRDNPAFGGKAPECYVAAEGGLYLYLHDDGEVKGGALAGQGPFHKSAAYYPTRAAAREAIARYRQTRVAAMEAGG